MRFLRSKYLQQLLAVEDFVEVLLTLMRKPNTEVYVSGSYETSYISGER